MLLRRGVVLLAVAFASLGAFWIPGAQGSDIQAAFQHPEAPDAGELKGLTMHGGIFVALLDDGTLAFHAPGKAGGGWVSVPGAALADSPEDLRGVSVLGYDCADLLGAVSTGAAGGEKEYAGNLCIFLWDYRSGGTDLARTSQDRNEDLLGGAIPPGETVRSSVTTTDDEGQLMALAVTDQAVYSVVLRQDGEEVRRQALNRRPEFIGTASGSCRSGSGVLEMTVEVRDADGDPVTLVDTATGRALTGATIRHECTIPGIYRRSIGATDGKTDGRRMPVREYLVTVTENLNKGPVWADFSVTGTVNTPGRFPAAKDPDGDHLTYSGSLPHLEIQQNGTYSPEQDWCGESSGPISVSDGRETTIIRARVTIPCPNLPARDFALRVSPPEVVAGTAELTAAVSAVADPDEGWIGTVIIRRDGAVVASGPVSAAYGGPFRKGETFSIAAKVDELVKEEERIVKNSPPLDPVKGAWPTVAAEKSALEIVADAGVAVRDPDPSDNGPPCPAAETCIRYVWGGEIPKGLAPRPDDSSVLAGTVAGDFIVGMVPAARKEVTFWVQKRDRDGALSNKVYHTMSILNAHQPF